MARNQDIESIQDMESIDDTNKQEVGKSVTLVALWLILVIIESKIFYYAYRPFAPFYNTNCIIVLLYLWYFITAIS